MSEPKWSPDRIISTLQSLSEQGDSAGMFTQATEFLEDRELPGLHKFRAIEAVSNFHKDHSAALQLLDMARSEMEAQPEWIRANLAYYEVRLRGDSRFMGELPAADQFFIWEAVGFLRDNPLQAELGVARQLMSASITSEDTERVIRDAVRNGAPLSVVRMGDGEGRFCYSLDKLPATKTYSEKTAMRIWFRNAQTLPGEEYWEAMRDSYRNATIVGVNPEVRINLSYRKYAIGYIGVVLGNRFIADAVARGSQMKIVPNWIFFLIGAAGMKRIVSEAKTVNFIGPHPGMTKFLADEMGAEKVNLTLIPADELVPSVVDRPHYPDVYEEVVAMIRKGVSGLWLVAAGAYAKIYCDEIRKAGGVGLDLGSLTDQWMGLKTR